MSSFRYIYLPFSTNTAPTVCSSLNPHRKKKCATVQQYNVYIFYVFILISISSAQIVSINGYIIDANTNLPISRSIIQLNETGEKKSSDERGYFRFDVHTIGSYTFSVHHIAYKDTEQKIVSSNLFNDTIIFSLQPKIFQSDGIIVNSTRTVSDVNNTPFPLNIVSSEHLLQQNSTTISDALKNSAGLSIVRDGAWETAVSIRGMSRSNIVMLVDNSRIETANDIAGALSLFNVHDLERVETIRSSGAALYGTGALGGILHLISKRTLFTDEFQMNSNVNSEFSSVNNCTSQYLAVEGSSEQFAGRFSGGYRKADNTVTPAGILPNSQFTDFNVTGSLGIKTYERQSLHLSYQRSQAENTGISGGAPISALAKATYKLTRREFFGLDYTIPNISQTVSLLTVRISQQNISRNVEIVQTPSLTLTPHAIHLTTSAQVESKITATENNFLIIGAEVWQRTLESKREKINNANYTITGERPIPHSAFLSAGLYGQDEWYLVPNKVTMILGARYDWIHISNDETTNPEYVISNGVLNTIPTNQIILWKSGTVKNESWSGNIGIQCSLLSNLDVSFLASTAFRSPSLEERYQYLTLGDGIHVGNPDLKPEQSISMNAGLRWYTSGTNIRTDFFLNQLTNLVTDVPGTFEGNAAFIKQNISEARLYGYEITGEQLFTSWSTMNVTVSYVRGEDTHNNANLSQIAPLHGNVELLVRNQDVGRISMSLSISAPQEFLGTGEKRTSGYAVFDIDAVSVPWTFERFSITTRGGIQNVFNKEYRNHLSTIRGNITSEPGRNFFLSITVEV